MSVRGKKVELTEVAEVKEKKEISYSEIKEKLVRHIKDNYKNINTFAHSELSMEVCKELDIKPEYVKMYLTPKGARSFKLIENLYRRFEMGNLEKKIFVEKRTVYYEV